MQHISTDLQLDPKTQAYLANPATLMAALLSGELRGFRITVEPVLGRGGEPPASTVASVVPPAESTGTPGLSDLIWEPLPQGKLFYRWPKKATDPLFIEQYDEAYRTVVQLARSSKTVVIGLTNRKAAGKDDRRRAVVFFGEPPAVYPIVEAAGANDFTTSGKLASAIKLPNGKFLKPGAPVPDEYAGMPLDLYTNIVQGPNAVNAMAVVVDAHDRDEMLRILTRQALIRAAWKGRP